jgi:phage pi2 protein 07
MDYKRIYDSFIADRLNKQPSKPDYFERHHILPKSLGGTNDPSNLINLTLEDHIHAHILLAKIHGGKLWGAISFMVNDHSGSRKNKRIPTKKEIALATFAKKMFSIKCRGETHSQFGRKHSEQARKQMSIAHKERAKNGTIWTQNNKHLISGDNSWTRKAEYKESFERALPKWNESIKKAIIANTGINNVMHRPEVKAKIRNATNLHWKNGTGFASKEARSKRLVAYSSVEYLKAASERMSGERNPNYGLNGGKNYNSRQVLCVEKNQIFNSVKEANLFCGGDVTKAARTGGMAGGFHWLRINTHATDGRVLKKCLQIK